MLNGLGNENIRRPLGRFVVLLVCFVLLYGYWQIKTPKEIQNLEGGNDLRIASIPRAGATDPNLLPYEITARYGDIFVTPYNHLKSPCNMIVVSATIDPLLVVDSMVYWSNNLMVRSFFDHARSTNDNSLFELGVKGLIVEMVSTNSEYLTFLSTNTREQIVKDESYLVSYCHPYIMKIPKGSLLYNYGIEWCAVLPLFNADQIESSEEKKYRLSINVRTAVGRLMQLISKMEDVHYVAFPALAGTEYLYDSHNYLTYRESFTEIINGIRSIQLPQNFHRAYLIVWDQLENLYGRREKEAALSSIGGILDDYQYEREGGRIIALFILVSFGISFLSWFKYFYLRKSSPTNKTTVFKKFLPVIVILIVLPFFSYIGFLATLTGVLISIHQVVPFALRIIIEIISILIVILCGYFLADQQTEKFKKKPRVKIPPPTMPAESN